MAVTVLPSESISLCRYDLGLIVPPSYILADAFRTSQIEHAFGQSVQSELYWIFRSYKEIFLKIVHIFPCVFICVKSKLVKIPKSIDNVKKEN